MFQNQSYTRMRPITLLVVIGIFVVLLLAIRQGAASEAVAGRA